MAKQEQNAFALALAARRGEIPPESISGAAKILYRDNTLSKEQLGEYAKPPSAIRPKQVGKTHPTFKRG